MKQLHPSHARLAHAAAVALEALESRRLFCFVHSDAAELMASMNRWTGDYATAETDPSPDLSGSYQFDEAATADADGNTASPASAAAVPGYVPLASSASPWATGYFTPSGTVDLQAGAALAPDISAGEAASLPRAMPVNAAGLPLLNSRSGGAGVEIFLDFARDEVGPDYRFGNFSLDGDRTTYNFNEQNVIYNAWREIVGYFAEFNVNVTTVLPPQGAADPNFAWLQISNEFAGGAAYVNSLNKFGPTGRINSGDAVGRVSGLAHELGHIFGLGHQANWDRFGNLVDEYSNGDGYRNVPTIGIDYNGSPNSRWFYGRASWGSGSGVIQDDGQWIANTISSTIGGDGWRTDDFGGTLAAAFTLAAGSQQLDGFTERYNDADVFKITATTAGPWNFTATPLYKSHAEPKLELLDASGNIIAARDDADLRNGPTNEQFLNVDLTAGTYYVRLSAGADYDELGYYKLGVAQLPNNMVSNDVGVPAYSGSVSYDAASGVFTQSAGGTDIWNTSDQFRFTYATLNDLNGSITARVDALDNIGAFTKAGVMIRQSLNGNSAHAYLGIRPDGGLDSIWRSASGAASANVNNAGGGPWVRITRAGEPVHVRTKRGWHELDFGRHPNDRDERAGAHRPGDQRWSSNREAFSTFSSVTITGNTTPTPPTYNALAAPASLTASPAPAANTSINLTWSATPGATGYRIERSYDGLNWSVLNSVGAVTSYTDVNPWGSMRWFYRVAAANGSSLYSAPSPIAHTMNKPNAPAQTGWTSTYHSVSTNDVQLNWIDVQGETGYRIDRSTDGVNYTFVANTFASQTSLNVGGLAADTAYTFRITPLTAAGDGVAAPLFINTQTRMGAVANLRFTAKSSTSMSIAWNDKNLETGFRVERSNDGTNWTFLGDAAQNVTTWTENGLTAGTEYYYRVLPFNALFGGDWAAPIFAGAPAASLPAGWTNADIGTVAGTGAAVSTGTGSWKAVSGGFDVFNNADGFNFTYRAVTADTTIVARIDTLEVTDNAAKAGLMFRQDLTAGSKSVAVMMNAGGGFGIDLRTRGAAGGGTAFQQLLGGVAAPYWLRLTRSGNSITAGYSSDGVNFSNATPVVVSLTGTFYVGLAVNSFSTTQLNTSTFSNVSVGVTGASPAVATPASATPNPVTGTTTNLSVLGADDGGEPNLTYGWSVTTKPAGVADPSFSANNGNGAKNTLATFSAAGNYSFTVAILDGNGLSTTSSVNVTVQAALTSIAVTPSVLVLGASTTQQLAASARDQFGSAMASQPSFSWSLVGGGGSVSASGLYAAPSTAASAVVRATIGSNSGTASVTVVSVGSEIAWYKFNESTGSTAFDNSGHNRNAALSTTGANFASGGTSGNALTLTGGQATLPNGIVSSVTGDCTIATWVKLGSVDTWSRIFDFGSGTGSYMFLTPAAGGTNRPRFGITTGGGGAPEQLVDSSVAIGTNTWTHVAIRLSGSTATMYINGAAVGSNSGVSLRPSSLGSTTQNYIGKSQYGADPQLNGSVDDFRIYARALTPAEIGALSAQSRFAYVLNNRLYVDFTAGTSLSMGTSGGNVTLTSGSTTLSFAPGSFVDVLVTGTPSVDSLTLLAAVPRPITFVSGGAGVGNDTFRVAAGASHTFDTDLSVASPSLAVEVIGTATFSASQRDLASLQVTGSAAIALGGQRVIATGTVNVTGGGKLDLADNNLIVRAGDIGHWDGAAYTGISGLIAAGRTINSTWDGPGIVTSTADAVAGLTTLGIADAKDVLFLNPGETALWEGQTVGAGTVIIKYTYTGDADLSGSVDATDYGYIDNYYQFPATTGNSNGDFNFDGVIDASDYGYIDNSFQVQGDPL
jgi:hypothetical protein